MALSLRRIKSEAGERFALLVDDEGVPLYYPTLYVSVYMRGRSLAVNTIQNALHAIKALYACQAYFNVNYELRFSNGELLQAHEVHSLRDFMQRPLANESGKKIIPITRPKSVSTENQYARLSVIAEYLGFLATQLLPPSTESSAKITAMIEQIKANRPIISNKSKGDRDEIYLDDAILDAIEKALQPGSPENPAHDYSVQLRNALMFMLLRATGLRRGELLNLKVEDIDFTKNILRVIRRPDSKGDARTYQPVAKTRERAFPLIPELVEKIHEYVVKHRNKVPNAKKHGYIFVTHKAGRFQGNPLSNAWFGKFIGELKGVVEGAGLIHAHSLRHHWNYSFSKTCETKGIASEREEKLRSYLMGWSETSGTAATYNRRHVKEQAREAVLELQKKNLKHLQRK
ncbi:tyrosine-type recombinase/integrase [Pseudomonas sp. GL-B-16]|uniref:tyrosine-type recombinase/integrase n=1 Tax=Pseudomonas sp. GL-B-16 TaxID=2832373 RepID=UPI001CC116BF|nr:site-specific integrase [Pseudomonas sp. GL-B-16]